MKQVQCPECGRKKDVNDFVVMAICSCCIVEMEEVDYGKNSRFQSDIPLKLFRSNNSL